MAVTVNIRTLEKAYHIDLSEFEHGKRYTMASIMIALGFMSGTPKMTHRRGHKGGKS